MTALTSPRVRKWAGIVAAAIPVAMLLMSAAMKFLQPPGFEEQFMKMGYPPSQTIGLGIVELLCTAIYLIPRTSVLGAILLTGYLGGAIATHVRVEDAFAVPLGLGVLVWASLWIRMPELRAMLPLRS